jgi:hypothetical protein
MVLSSQEPAEKVTAGGEPHAGMKLEARFGAPIQLGGVEALLGLADVLQ